MCGASGRWPSWVGYKACQLPGCRRWYNVNMIKIALLFTLAALSLGAQDWARQKVDKSPRHREWVTVKHDGRDVETFVAYPESSRKTPVVLVIHEIFGMT